MTLSSGLRVGAYEFVRPIGAGGMVEVYLAHDARLNRDVAIKLLPHQFTLDLGQGHCTLLQQRMWRCRADFCRAISREKSSEV
jgi:serine/threonine protein kinase